MKGQVLQVDLESAGFTKNKLVSKNLQLDWNQLTKCILKADVVAVTISKYVDALGEKYKSENH
jgi:hypothetical protein